MRFAPGPRRRRTGSHGKRAPASRPSETTRVRSLLAAILQFGAVWMSQDGPAETFPSVAVTIVTYNSAKYIRGCLEYVLSQDYPRTQVIVVDNASADNTPLELQAFQNRITVVRNDHNAGFAGGQNQAIAACQADWILTLNPDVRLTSGFISKLVAAGAG